MFQISETSFLSDIGKQNVIKCRELLKKYNIPGVGEDVEGTKGRTIDFVIRTGSVFVKRIKEEPKEI